MSLKLAEDVLRDRVKHDDVTVTLAEAYVAQTKRLNAIVIAANDCIESHGRDGVLDFGPLLRALKP